MRHRELKADYFKLLSFFLVYALYLGITTTRKGPPDDSGYYLSATGLRIPLFRAIQVLVNAWKDMPGDDNEVGQTLMTILDRMPFGKFDVLFHCVQTFIGYGIEENAKPETVIAHCRLLNRQMTYFGIASKFIQVRNSNSFGFEVANAIQQGISQGCWSTFRPESVNTNVMELRYKITSKNVKTEYGEPKDLKKFSPMVIVNRLDLLAAKAGERASIYNAIRAVILTAMRFEPKAEAGYGMRLRGNPSFMGLYRCFRRMCCFSLSYSVR